jgi:hypothetical protein
MEEFSSNGHTVTTPESTQAEPEQQLLGVYLVSVSGGHQADLGGTDRPNRNPTKTLVYIKIETFPVFLVT